MEFNAQTEQASASTANVALDFLGVPYPDPGTCRAEQDELFSWVSANGGH